MDSPVPVAKPVLLESEKMPFEKWDRARITAMIQECQGVPDAISLDNGADYFPRGIYQLFETPDGARIGIMGLDPEDMPLGNFIVDERWSRKLRLKKDQLGEMPVEAGATFKGDYLRDNGDGNLSRLLVFTARPGYQADKWFGSETTKHNEALLAFLEEQARIIHHDPQQWTANGITYQLVDNKKFNIRGDAGSQEREQLYDLVVTRAPVPGWHLSEEFERLFSGVGGRLMRKFSVKMRNVTQEQGEKIARHDFKRRLHHLFNAQDPYSLLFNGNAAGRTVWKFPPDKSLRRRLYRRPWMKRILRKRFDDYARGKMLHWVYAARQQSRVDVAKTVGGLAIGNGALYLLSVLLDLPVSPIVPMAKVTGQAVTRTGMKVVEFMRRQQRLMTDDPIQKLISEYTIDWDPSQVWGGRLNPDCVPFLRAIPEKRLVRDRHFAHRTVSRLPTHYDALANIYNPTVGETFGFSLGDHACFRIDSPTGLSVEYIPGRKLRIAKYDPARTEPGYTLRRSIRALFHDAPEGEPFVAVRYDDDHGLYKHNFMSQADYETMIREIRESKCPGPLHAGDPMPNFQAAEDLKKTSMSRGVRSWIRKKLGKVFSEGQATAITEGIESGVEAAGDALKGPRL